MAIGRAGGPSLTLRAAAPGGFRVPPPWNNRAAIATRVDGDDNAEPEVSIPTVSRRRRPSTNATEPVSAVGALGQVHQRSPSGCTSLSTTLGSDLSLPQTSLARTQSATQLASSALPPRRTHRRLGRPLTAVRRTTGAGRRPARRLAARAAGQQARGPTARSRKSA